MLTKSKAGIANQPFLSTYRKRLTTRRQISWSYDSSALAELIVLDVYIMSKMLSSDNN